MTKDFRNWEKQTITTLIAFSFIFSGATFAHFGNTDAKGCHTDHSTNQLHCHEEPVLTSATPEITKEPSSTIAKAAQDSSSTLSEIEESVERVTAEVTTESSSTALVEKSSAKAILKVKEEVATKISEAPETETALSEVVEESASAHPVSEIIQVETTLPVSKKVLIEPPLPEITKKSTTMVTEVNAESAPKSPVDSHPPTIKREESAPKSPAASHPPTPTTVELTYETGIQVGIRQCQNDPASCGIKVNPCTKMPSPWRAPDYRYHPPRVWYPPFPPRRRY